VITAILLAFAGQEITVGGFEKAPPVIVAEGDAPALKRGRRAAKQCGIPLTLSYNGALWAPTSDVSPAKLRCVALRLRAA
jgi:hypothetical protein